jgi:hypothetical protein
LLNYKIFCRYLSWVFVSYNKISSILRLIVIHLIWHICLNRITWQHWGGVSNIENSESNIFVSNITALLKHKYSNYLTSGCLTGDIRETANRYTERLSWQYYCSREWNVEVIITFNWNSWYEWNSIIVKLPISLIDLCYAHLCK